MERSGGFVTRGHVLKQAEDPTMLTFDDLFERERAPMVGVAYLLTRSTAVAEELVHDAFVDVYERWDKLERPGAYLRRCVVNRAMRHNRRRTRGRLAEVGARRASTTEAEMSFDHTLDAVAGLEEKARTVVVLRYYAALTQEEIAETLGIPTGTVKSRLHRALADLRKVLS